MITLRALPFITATALLLPACADDDSNATTDGSSSTTGTPDPDPDPATGSTTGMGTTAATDTGATETGTDTGSATGGTTTGADDSGSSTGPSAGLEIVGEWFEEFSPGMGITHVIDPSRWDQLADFGDAIFHIDGYDNDAGYVLAQGDATNEFFPELWSRFDWTWDGPDLYYCTAVYDAATVEDALSAPLSDSSDLEMGCGGFPWSRLLPQG